MGSAHVELEDFITPGRVEHAYGLACQAQRLRQQTFADTGWRAARARDPKLLKVLELATEIVRRMENDQFGRTFRTASDQEKHKYQQGTTEAQLWQKAYETCDSGEPMQNFEWIYGAAAYLCGYNT